MPAILFVRVKSNLEPTEFDRRLLERRPRFQAVPGLTQKVYGRDPRPARCVASTSSRAPRPSLRFARRNSPGPFRAPTRPWTCVARFTTSSIRSGPTADRFLQLRERSRKSKTQWSRPATSPQQVTSVLGSPRQERSRRSDQRRSPPQQGHTIRPVPRCALEGESGGTRKHVLS